MENVAAIWVFGVIGWIELVLLLFALCIEVFAFVNCLIQKSENFAAIGTLSKGAWLALTGGAALVTLFSLRALGLLGLIAITIAAIYILDIRPALRDAVDGAGPW